MTFVLRGMKRGLQKVISCLIKPCAMICSVDGRGEVPDRTAFTRTPWSSNQKRFVTYRVACAIFTLSILIWSVPTDSNRWITFYSNWMYATLTLHYCYSAAVCLQEYRRTGRHDGPSERTLRIGWIIYDMAMATSLTVSAEYWLSPWPVTIGLRSILRHALNSIMVVIDVLVCGLPSRLDRIVYPVLHQGVYCVFLVLYWLGGFRGYDGKQYIYSFMDLNTVPLQATVIMFGNTFLVMPVFHIFVCVLYRTRLKLLKNCKNRNDSNTIKETSLQTLDKDTVNGKETSIANGVGVEIV